MLFDIRVIFSFKCFRLWPLNFVGALQFVGRPNSVLCPRISGAQDRIGGTLNFFLNFFPALCVKPDDAVGEVYALPNTTPVYCKPKNKYIAAVNTVILAHFRWLYSVAVD